jgi:putative tryptophan/tyrosine transport system substrate-binding protein
MFGMNRREFITVLGGAAVWPLAARAQQMPIIGILNGGGPDEYVRFVAAFRQALSEAGYIEGHNLATEYRSADGHYERLPSLAAELVARQVALIFAIGGGASALAAKAVTPTIPIVFANGSDPIGLGLVASINRPGANVTGVSFFGLALEAKRLEFLSKLVPDVMKIGFVVNLRNPSGALQAREVKAAADVLGKQLEVLPASADDEIAAAFAIVTQHSIGAVQVGIDPFLLNRKHQLIAQAARRAVPTIYPNREFAEAGGLISYGTSLVDAYRQAAGYVSRILKGEKPTDLPVLQPTRFELMINLKTAKALGLTVPQSLLVAADEVIE